MQLSDMIPINEEIERARQSDPAFRELWDAGDQLPEVTADVATAEWRREALAAVERLTQDPEALADVRREALDWAELDVEVHDEPYEPPPSANSGS
jgi:hypothetical protein